MVDRNLSEYPGASYCNESFWVEGLVIFGKCSGLVDVGRLLLLAVVVVAIIVAECSESWPPYVGYKKARANNRDGNHVRVILTLSMLMGIIRAMEKTSYFPFHWLVHRDPCNGLIKSPHN